MAYFGGRADGGPFPRWKFSWKINNNRLIIAISYLSHLLDTNSLYYYFHIHFDDFVCTANQMKKSISRFVQNP